MTKPEKTKPSPFCLRLNAEERALLEHEAAGMSLGDWASISRQRVFDEKRTKRRMRGKTPVKDHALLNQLISELGKNRISNNLNQIAKATNQGALYLSPEIEALLVEACADIKEIRRVVMAALGLGV
ncbi:MAG: plasmid mobilization relaxosome protein MobC [Alphaproteobacteria bacterium]